MVPFFYDRDVMSPTSNLVFDKMTRAYTGCPPR